MPLLLSLRLVTGVLFLFLAQPNVEAPPTTAPVPLPEGPIELRGGVHVEVVGIAAFPARNGWHTADGKPAPDPSGNFGPLSLLGGAPRDPTHQLAVLTVAPEAAVRVAVPQAEMTVSNTAAGGDDPAEVLHLLRFALFDGKDAADLVVQIADGPWEQVVEANIETPDWEGRLQGSSHGAVVISDMVPDVEGGIAVWVVTELADGEWRVVAINDAGELVQASRRSTSASGRIKAARVAFPLERADVRAFRIEHRPFNKRVVIRNLTLDAARPTRPEVEITE